MSPPCHHIVSHLKKDCLLSLCICIASGTADSSRALIFTLCIITETRFSVLIVLLESTKQSGTRTIQ